MKRPLGVCIAAALWFCVLASSAQAEIFLNTPALSQELAAIKLQALRLATISKAPAVPSSPAPPKDKFPVRGIDISTYQGEIDWDVVKNQGLSFVFIKATEGESLIDDAFERNWKATARAQLRHGAYHFYNFCKTGRAQAANFIRTVPREANALAPTVDLEFSSACRVIPSKASFRKELADFIREVKFAYGRAPILYVNGGIYDRYFKDEKDENPIWITSPREAPSFPDKRDWIFWQYSYSGRVKGIAGEVDLDVFNGTAEEFALWAPRIAQAAHDGL